MQSRSRAAHGSWICGGHPSVPPSPPCATTTTPVTVLSLWRSRGWVLTCCVVVLPWCVLSLWCAQGCCCLPCPLPHRTPRDGCWSQPACCSLGNREGASRPAPLARPPVSPSPSHHFLASPLGSHGRLCRHAGRALGRGAGERAGGTARPRDLTGVHQPSTAINTSAKSRPFFHSYGPRAGHSLLRRRRRSRKQQHSAGRRGGCSSVLQRRTPLARCATPRPCWSWVRLRSHA